MEDEDRERRRHRRLRQDDGGERVEKVQSPDQIAERENVGHGG